MKLTSIIEERQELTHVLAGWTLQIIVYRLGLKYVCIIENSDPGATICRATGLTREEAVRTGVQNAAELLSSTVTMNPISNVVHKPVEISSITCEESGETLEMTVSQFLERTLQERMKLILSGCLKFFDSSKRQIDSGTAMKLLNSASRT